jgi:hypothetical protein
MTLTVLTASHGPDFASFARLHASVVRNTDPDVQHVVVVPDAHVDLFRTVATSRLDVRGYRQVLPRRFLQTTWLAGLPGLPRGFRVAALNAARPWPPVRGWILQQVVKLAVAAALESDVALLVDSDVLVVRPLEEPTLRNGAGTVRLYRRPGGITPDMTRHVAQRRRALDLLGLHGVEPGSPDYISAFVSWDPVLVRACLGQIEAKTRRRWWDVVAGSLDLSEFITYGTYAMTLAGAEARGFVRDRSLCHSHWDPSPLDLAAARRFLAAMPADDLAIHIQSNSGTDESVLEYLARAAATG